MFFSRIRIWSYLILPFLYVKLTRPQNIAIKLTNQTFIQHPKITQSKTPAHRRSRPHLGPLAGRRAAQKQHAHKSGRQAVDLFSHRASSGAAGNWPISRETWEQPER